MTLESFFFICFGVGLTLSAVSFLAGSMHLHLPTKFHLNIGKLHLHGGGAHTGAPGAHGHTLDVSPFNFPSLMAFLAWFGGVGYLMTHHYGAGLALSLAASIGGGLLGGAIVYAFLRKLMSFDGSLDPEDFQMEGVIGKLATNLRAGGTAELIYQQAGTRRVCAARAEGGERMEKGSEVVVTRYERGIAYVRRWEEFAEEHHILSDRSEK